MKLKLQFNPPPENDIILDRKKVSDFNRWSNG